MGRTSMGGTGLNGAAALLVGTGKQGGVARFEMPEFCSVCDGLFWVWTLESSKPNAVEACRTRRRFLRCLDPVSVKLGAN
jgi:hypothetical protein